MLQLDSHRLAVLVVLAALAVLVGFQFSSCVIGINPSSDVEDS